MPGSYLCVNCGDRICNSAKGENACNCAQDCNSDKICGKNNLLPIDSTKCSASGGELLCANCPNDTDAANCVNSTCTCDCSSNDCIREGIAIDASTMKKCCKGLEPVNGCAGSSSLSSCAIDAKVCAKTSKCKTLANLGGVFKYAPSIIKLNNKFYLAGIGTDNALWVAEYSITNATQNVSWYSLGGYATSGSYMSGETSSAGSELTIQVIGGDNKLWQRTYSTITKKWSEWDLSSNHSFAKAENFKSGPNSAFWSDSANDPNYKYSYRPSLTQEKKSSLEACTRNDTIVDVCEGKSCGWTEATKCCNGYECIAPTGKIKVGLSNSRVVAPGVCYKKNIIAPAICGNGVCETGENKNTCGADCDPYISCKTSETSCCINNICVAAKNTCQQGYKSVFKGCIDKCQPLSECVCASDSCTIAAKCGSSLARQPKNSETVACGNAGGTWQCTDSNCFCSCNATCSSNALGCNPI